MLAEKKTCVRLCAPFFHPVPAHYFYVFLHISTPTCRALAVLHMSTYNPLTGPKPACSGTAQPCCVLCCNWEPCFPRSPISQRVHLWGSHGLNIHGVEPSLMTVPHWWLFDLVFARRNASRAACKCWRRVSCWTGWQCAAYANFFWEKYRCWDGVFWDFIINNICIYIYIYLYISLYIYRYEYLRANSMVFLYSREPSYIIHTFFT